MIRVVVGATPRNLLSKVTYMVLHSLSSASPKWNEISKSMPFRTRDRLYGHQFARLVHNRAHLQKSADKIFPREGQPQGIHPPQTCADRRTPARGHRESPAVAQLRHQLLPAACSQELERVSRSAELLIGLQPRRRDEAMTPPKWSTKRSNYSSTHGIADNCTGTSIPTIRFISSSSYINDV